MNKAIRIIHLEDQRSDADIVKRELDKSDIQFEILWVTNKKDFQKALNEFSAHIILSDHSLPSFNSQQALKIVREEHLDIPFILVTATMSDEFAVSLMREGIADYILKDRLQRLPKAILNAIEKYDGEKEKQRYFEKIIRNEKLFRALIEHNKESITLLDKDFQPFDIGLSKVSITDYTFGEREKLNALELTHPDDRELVKKVMQDVLNNPGVPIHVVSRIKHKKGDYIWAEGTVTNLLENDVVKGIVANLRDVTEQKRAEAAIKESEQRYRNIVETAQEGIWTIDENNNTSFVNKKLAEILEYAPEEMVGKNVFDFLYIEDEKQAIKLIENQKNEPVQNIEFRFITKNGKEVWTSIASNGIYNEEGKYKGVLAMVTNVTEKKARQKQEEFDRNNLSALINNTKDLMWSVDKDFNLITSNHPFDEMCKVTFERVIEKGSSVLSVAYTVEMQEHFRRFYERAFAGEIFMEVEHFTSPVEYWTEISYYPIRKGNEIIGTACHSRDITHIKIAKRKIEESESQIRNFAKHLNKIQEEERSHLARELHDELGQQLAGIKMGLSLITMLKDKEKMVDKAKFITKDVDDAINSMRKVATELRPGILDSLGLIASLEWLVEEFERKKGIKCTIKTNVKKTIFEKTTSTCFFRVCQESLTNIFKHAQASEVNIQVFQNDRELILTVTDNGKGISTEKINNPFSMGLLGMKERAGVIGAELTVTSQANEGTTIRLRTTL